MQNALFITLFHWIYTTVGHSFGVYYIASTRSKNDKYMFLF